MSNTLPNWLKGKHLTAVTANGCSVDAAGVITDGTDRSLAGYIDAVMFDSSPSLEMIQSVDRTVAHYENIYEDFTMTLVEILRIKQGSATPFLPTIAAGFNIIKFVFTRGGQTYTMYGQRGDYKDGVQGFGKNSCSLTIRPVDIGTGTGNPVALT